MNNEKKSEKKSTSIALMVILCLIFFVVGGISSWLYLKNSDNAKQITKEEKKGNTEFVEAKIENKEIEEIFGLVDSYPWLVDYSLLKKDTISVSHENENDMTMRLNIIMPSVNELIITKELDTPLDSNGSNYQYNSYVTNKEVIEDKYYQVYGEKLDWNQIDEFGYGGGLYKNDVDNNRLLVSPTSYEGNTSSRAIISFEEYNDYNNKEVKWATINVAYAITYYDNETNSFCISSYGKCDNSEDYCCIEKEEDFKFTNDNINDFPHVKFIFKNDNGTYHLYDIKRSN